jgi:regulator of protease activity HflC (stomatin/prohibitin superfamily)
VAKLRVFDQVQASRLVRFGKYGRYLGNGLAVIDFGSRIDKIHGSYEAGEPCRVHSMHHK